MTTRSTTLVESDQLAQAAVNVIRTEDLVPKGKRWPFSRTSKAHRDYEKAVQDITARRREAREQAVEQKLKKERLEADATFDQAKATAQTVHDTKIADAKKPYDEIESQARAERDAAIAAANLAYQQAMDSANRIYVQETAVIDDERDGYVAEAKSVHDAAYAAIEDRRKADMALIAKDLKTIPLEGPMRVVEDKQAWSLDERKKALIGIIDMAGREDFDTEYVDLCLRNVAGYVFQDRYLKPEEQHHRLMDVILLQALVELARRTPEKRPTVVKYMHDIVVQNPGHSAPAFIKQLTELYVIASSDAETIYDQNVDANEQIFDAMRAHIADTLKLTPRRNLAAAPGSSNAPAREATQATPVDDRQTPVMVRSDADITADVDVSELVPFEHADASDSQLPQLEPVEGKEPTEVPESATTAAYPPATQGGSSPPTGSAPPAPTRRPKRTRVPESST